MPRYYFHVRYEDKFIHDYEGTELPGVKAAFHQAEDAAREILAGMIRRGDPIDGEEFEVEDDLGKTVFHIPFKSVLRMG
jgi:hypothetical protein